MRRRIPFRPPRRDALAAWRLLRREGIAAGSMRWGMLQSTSSRQTSPPCRLPPAGFFVLSCSMTAPGREWFRSVIVVALCFAFAALLWTAGGAVFERPVLDEAAHSED